jgi:hypothetical protein
MEAAVQAPATERMRLVAVIGAAHRHWSQGSYGQKGLMAGIGLQGSKITKITLA